MRKPKTPSRWKVAVDLLTESHGEPDRSQPWTGSPSAFRRRSENGSDGVDHAVSRCASQQKRRRTPVERNRETGSGKRLILLTSIKTSGFLRFRVTFCESDEAFEAGPGGPKGFPLCSLLPITAPPTAILPGSGWPRLLPTRHLPRRFTCSTVRTSICWGHASPRPMRCQSR